ncbi:MAG: LysM peptidoglycan-binding domain-containing protein [Gammaproteobacteria bacterium]|nr:LysM peptidoglycan-binding domain-containing protein [Gammaproteobacteria bacterium]
MNAYVVNETTSLDNNNKINFTTNRVEELWTELSQAWPAVKNNPEIAEKIEKLWDILKTSGNDHLEISREIHNLISNNNSDTIFTPGSATNSSQTESSNIKPIETITTSLHTTAQDDDIDSLLADIIGDDNKTEAIAIGGSSSNAEELDKLVASILGEDWLKEESNISPLDDSQITKTEQHIGSSKSNHSIFKSNPDIDSLVSSILANDSNENIITPVVNEVLTKNKQLTSDKQDIDKLLNEILNEDDLDEKSTIDKNPSSDNIYKLNSEEKIDDLINDIINKDTYSINTTSSLSNITNEEQPAITGAKQEENIDDLINDIINKDTTSSLSNITNEEQPAITASKQEENIDDLINDIINKDTTSSSSNITNEKQIQTADSSPEENIDDLINNILEDKTDSNIIEENELNEEEIVITDINDNSSFQATNSRVTNKVTPPPIPNTVKTSTSYKQPEKESNNTLIIIILIILILGFIGVWKMFFSNKESLQRNITIQEQYTDITSSTKEDSPVIEETYTQAKIYETEPEYSPPAMEQSTNNNEAAYSALIEQDMNDIIITLNSPETAIESNDSTIFNTNEAIGTIEVEPLADNNINTTKSITEPTSPAKTPGKNELITEKAKQEKPVKTVAKRRIIIHKIVKGDTLWAIAKRYVNNPYRYSELAKLSKIKNPNRIYPGNKVKIIIYIK